MPNSVKTKPKRPIKPFRVDQALVGLEVGDTDLTILKYFDFFCQQVHVGGAYFLHVLPQFSLRTALYEKETQTLIGEYKVDKDMINQMAEKVTSNLSSHRDMGIEFNVVEGDPLEEMIKVAKNIKAELLVIGQERGKQKHGIFAKNLARSTTANALIIPNNAQAQISTILVPIDFSESSAKALETAIAIKQSANQPCRIICVNVYSMPNTNYFRNETPWLETKDKVEENLKDGFHAFLELVAGDFKNDIEIALIERVTTGTANFIVDYANKNKVDFIVMGARGHSKVHLLLMGSVTEGVVDLNSSIPTLIVKE